MKDVFQWDDGYHESFKKIKMREMQRSPTKWQTENRDVYRKFVDHEQAQKMEKKKSEEEVMHEQNKCKCGATMVRSSEEVVMP